MKLDEKQKKIVIAAVIVVALALFFVFAKQASPDYFQNLGLTMPLPLFTAMIAIIDGFNPCTMWVLTFLLVLLISVSESRKRIYAVGYTFVGVVFVIYFLFMAAWLNIFIFLGVFDAIRIAVALLALFAGAINVKDFFFFRKGITLMIQEEHKKPLLKRLEGMKEVIKYGSMPALVGASATLALFSSIVELPCTAGWPVIYTNILVSRGMPANCGGYYGYLLMYNLIYIIPLATIIALFGYIFQGKQITREQMKILKLIGGVIMIALGIILLVNPALLMLA
jgi:cytochrome c biogenesis protein CcdA